MTVTGLGRALAAFAKWVCQLAADDLERGRGHELSVFSAPFGMDLSSTAA